MTSGCCQVNIINFRFLAKPQSFLSIPYGFRITVILWSAWKWMIEIFGSKHQQHSRVVWMEAKLIVTIPMQKLPFIVMLLISHTDIIPRYKLLIMQLALNTQYLFFFWLWSQFYYKLILSLHLIPEWYKPYWYNYYVGRHSETILTGKISSMKWPNATSHPRILCSWILES